MSHADEVVTDVNRKRLAVRADRERFALAWDYPGRTLLEVRVLRSRRGFAADAAAGAASGQEVVYHGVTGTYRDDTPLPSGVLYYTVFARHPGEEWVCWGRFRRPAGRRPGQAAGKGLRSWLRRLRSLAGRRPAAVALAACLAAAGAALPGRAAAATPAATPTPRSDEAARAAAAARAASPVAALLAVAGPGVETAVAPWAAAGARGYSVTFAWERPLAATVRLPLLHQRGARPRPPFHVVTCRLRLERLTALRVDLLDEGGRLRLLQAVPVPGASPFVLREQTWRPFDRLPWLAARPWLPLPPFAVVAAAVAARAWLRSRAWNRRLPSMTRHDREFVGRVVTLLVLAAGLAWQVYEGWYAATGPSLVPEAWWAGSLASLPLLLVPPALYLAALVLDLSPAPHRGAWALVALLAGAASVFNVAVAMTGTVTNLTLSYSLLLALLAVLALPRAFSRGRMGWSRQAFPGAA